MCDMTTSSLRSETLLAVALMVVVGWSVPATAEKEGQAENKVRVAVMNFENNSSWHYWGDNLGRVAADELVTQLFGTGKFSLVERTQLDAVLAEQNLGQSGRVNSSQVAEIG
jgi:curli biogenesis system outer membrane secretion channel CsgG